jgi:hypothetical protein
VADGGGDDLVKVAYANDPIEAEMIKGILEDAGIRSMLDPPGLIGPQVGYGLLPHGFDGGSRGVMVNAERAQEARELLAEVRSGGEEAAPDIANARYLEDARGGRGPRNYGVIGGYARAWIWSILAMAVSFGVFLLLRAV